MEVFLTLKFWFVNENLPKWMLNPLFLIKNVFVFSHLDSSLALQRKMVKMRLKGQNMGFIYMHRVQGSPKDTQILIKKHIVQYMTIYSHTN